MDLLHFKDNASNRDVISLFSGAMGLDIGLAKAGLNIVIGQDFDTACVATMRANGHKVLDGDIRKIDEADLLEQAGLAQGEPFLICGGPPCQPFSTAFLPWKMSKGLCLPHSSISRWQSAIKMIRSNVWGQFWM